MSILTARLRSRFTDKVALAAASELIGHKRDALLLQIMLPAFSFVVPCFNEAARIGDTIGATLDYLGQISPASELIVVNVGSADPIWTIARETLPGARIDARLLENVPNRSKVRPFEKDWRQRKNRYVAKKPSP